MQLLRVRIRIHKVADQAGLMPLWRILHRTVCWGEADALVTHFELILCRGQNCRMGTKVKDGGRHLFLSPLAKQGVILRKQTSLCGSGNFYFTFSI